jgi:hypothetical protein
MGAVIAYLQAVGLMQKQSDEAKGPATININLPSGVEVKDVKSTSSDPEQQ